MGGMAVAGPAAGVRQDDPQSEPPWGATVPNTLRIPFGDSYFLAWPLVGSRWLDEPATGARGTGSVWQAKTARSANARLPVWRGRWRAVAGSTSPRPGQVGRDQTAGKPVR